MQWLFSFAPMSLSFLSLAVAIWCYVRVRKLLVGASARSIAQLSSEVAELLSAFESLSASHRKLGARVGMREVRQRGEEMREAARTTTKDLGTAPIPKSELKEIARARGFKVS